MKVITTSNVDITVPKSSTAFAYKTAPELPAAHMVSLAIGKRGSGKTVAITNLVKHLKYDIIYVISPTFKSNSLLMTDLEIPDENVWEDPDDPNVVSDIIQRVEEERDILEQYLEDMKEYKMFLKMLKNKNTMVSDEMLFKFFPEGELEPPKHMYGGRNPFIGLLIDDCQSSKLFSNKRIQNLTIKHRHIGAFSNNRPSIGLSMFFLVQNYKSKSGGLDRAIRNNATNALIFKSKDEKELEFIASEMSGEVSKDKFMQAYKYAVNDGDHPFLFIDLHKKKNHPSMFRSRFNKFLLVDE